MNIDATICKQEEDKEKDGQMDSNELRISQRVELAFIIIHLTVLSFVCVCYTIAKPCTCCVSALPFHTW